jgi:hypothetical protein
MRCENPSWESKCVLEREEAEMGVMAILANPTGPMLSEAASAGFVRKSAPPAVLREADAKYAALAHPGVNAEGKTVRAQCGRAAGLIVEHRDFDRWPSLPIYPQLRTCRRAAITDAMDQNRKSRLPLIAHHALAGVGARHIREFTLEGGRRRPAVEPFLFYRGGDQRGVRGLRRAVDDEARTRQRLEGRGD